MSMLSARRSVVAGLTVVAALVAAPTPALAASTVPLTTAEFASALKQIQAATAAREAGGWRQDATTTFGGSAQATDLTRYDPASGRTEMTESGSSGPVVPGEPSTSRTRSVFAERGTGSWSPVRADPDTTRALRLLGRSSAAYVLEPTWAAAIADVRESAASNDLVSLSDAVTSVTMSLQDDGTIVYSGSFIESADSPFPPGTVQLRVSGDGVIVGLSEQLDLGPLGSSGVDVSVTYGPQSIVVPAPSTYVTARQLNRALAAVVLPTTMRSLASTVAREASARARAAHRAVTPADIVAVAPKVVAGADIRVTVTRVRGGVRLSAVNPYTHVRVAKRVVVEPAPVVHNA